MASFNELIKQEHMPYAATILRRQTGALFKFSGESLKTVTRNVYVGSRFSGIKIAGAIRNPAECMINTAVAVSPHQSAGDPVALDILETSKFFLENQQFCRLIVITIETKRYYPTYL